MFGYKRKRHRNARTSHVWSKLSDSASTLLSILTCTGSYCAKTHLVIQSFSFWDEPLSRQPLTKHLVIHIMNEISWGDQRFDDRAKRRYRSSHVWALFSFWTCIPRWLLRLFARVRHSQWNLTLFSFVLKSSCVFLVLVKCTPYLWGYVVKLWNSPDEPVVQFVTSVGLTERNLWLLFSTIWGVSKIWDGSEVDSGAVPFCHYFQWNLYQMRIMKNRNWRRKDVQRRANVRK